MVTIRKPAIIATVSQVVSGASVLVSTKLLHGNAELVANVIIVVGDLILTALGVAVTNSKSVTTALYTPVPHDVPHPHPTP